MDKRILMLRFSYWTGAVLDALWVIPMLFPQVGGRLFGLKNFNPDGKFRYVSACGAALMLGWTALLLWADRKPVERRGVLLLTILPVKVCLDLAKLWLVKYAVVPLEKLLAASVDAVFLYALFIFSYVYSNSLVKNEKRSANT